MLQTAASERKFVANGTQGDFALAWLEHVCRWDPEYPFGIVSSIYFDTGSKRIFSEKENGDLLKTKVRLRWYKDMVRDEDTEIPCFLEIKERIGGGRVKDRVQMKVRGGWIDSVPLESPELPRFIMEQAPRYSYLFYRELFPLMTVVYKRHRFVCPVTGARVCLDTHLHSDRVNSHHLPSALPEEVGTIVLEIKDAETVDIAWMEELYLHGFRERSFSKYYECVLQSMNGGISCE
jgi:hypothetical protein